MAPALDGPMNKSAVLDRVALDGAGLSLCWRGGLEAVIPLLWLRDACRCEACYHPTSGQRLLDVMDLPAEALATAAEIGAGDALHVIWQDGHQSRFEAGWLYDQAIGAPEEAAPILWRRAAAEAIAPVVYERLIHDEGALLRWLEGLRDHGFARLSAVPARPGAVEAVVALFGCIRETNYGRIFDVIAAPGSNNIAYTSHAIGLHTDNAYREQVPCLQLLHCLHAASDGGESTLVDGFSAAERLRRRSPEAFSVLAGEPVTFRFRDANNDLTHTAPTLDVDARGRLRGVRVSHPSLSLPPWTVERHARFFAAYRAFFQELSDPEAQLSFTMGSGDLFVTNNHRVLHGRTAFHGARHLQGCYVDVDALHSRIAVLRRRSERRSA